MATEEKAAPAPAFKAGDRVQWTHVAARNSGERRQIGFTTRTGKIVTLGNGSALVRMRNGRTERVRLNSLRKEGEPSELTEAVVAAGRKEAS